MKEFGIFYFEVGWIIMIGIGLILGSFAGYTQKFWIVGIYIVIILILGGTAFYGKYYIGT